MRDAAKELIRDADKGEGQVGTVLKRRGVAAALDPLLTLPVSRERAGILRKLP